MEEYSFSAADRIDIVIVKYNGRRISGILTLFHINLNDKIFIITESRFYIRFI